MPAAKSRKKQKRAAALHNNAATLVALTMILAGFFLPWLDYKASGFDEAILGCPETQLVEGWRLPYFAHDAEQAWIVRFAQVFSSDEADRSKAWLVYASPLAGLLGIVLLGTKRRILWRLLAGAANTFLLLILMKNLQEPLPDPPLSGIEISYGAGILLSAAGHGVMCWAALARRTIR